MKYNNPDKKKVLFFSRSFKCKGGVVNYCEALLEEISPNFHIDHNVIGDRPDNNSVLLRFLYPIYDTVRLCYKLFRNSYDIIHTNPSLIKNALIRDSFYLLVLSLFGYSSKTIVFFHGWDKDVIHRLNRYVFFKSIFIHLHHNVGKILVLATIFKQQLIDWV